MIERPLTTYALLGSGRVARHLHFYLSSLNLSVLLWSRNGDPAFNTSDTLNSQDRLKETVARSSHVLFALKDEAIGTVSERFQGLEKTLVHFSGALQLPRVYAAHPLMTFGAELEELEWYRQLQFVLDEGVSLAQVLPGLPNSSWPLAAGKRPYYHALCSLAGNSSFLLWHLIGDEFEKSLQLPRELLKPFLHQVVSNSGASGFTGPVARGDWETIRKHLESLNTSPDLLKAYQSYLRLAKGSNHPIPESLL